MSFREGASGMSLVLRLYASPTSLIRLPLTARPRSLSTRITRCNVVRHVFVDIIGELDEAERLTQLASHPPARTGSWDPPVGSGPPPQDQG